MHARNVENNMDRNLQDVWLTARNSQTGPVAGQNSEIARLAAQISYIARLIIHRLATRRFAAQIFESLRIYEDKKVSLVKVN